MGRPDVDLSPFFIPPIPPWTHISAQRAEGGGGVQPRGSVDNPLHHYAPPPRVSEGARHMTMTADADDAVELLVRKRLPPGGEAVSVRVAGGPPQRGFLYRTDAPFPPVVRKLIAPSGETLSIQILCSGGRPGTSGGALAGLGLAAEVRSPRRSCRHCSNAGFHRIPCQDRSTVAAGFVGVPAAPNVSWSAPICSKAKRRAVGAWCARRWRHVPSMAIAGAAKPQASTRAGKP